MAQAPIRVAIIGGGLGGTLLLNCLLKHKHLDPHVYEAGSQINERGASVSLAENAQRALEIMGLEGCLARAGAVPLHSFRIEMGNGPDAGELVADRTSRVSTMHRTALLRELLAPIPKDRLHVNKRFVSIDDMKIAFQDGTSVEVDAIIGADGIHSSVREHVLGKGHPALKPVYAGFWDCRNIVPVEEAVAKLGARLDLEAPVQHLYCGDKNGFYHDIIDDGKTVCVIGSGFTPPEWDQTQWKQTVTREWLNSQYKSWGEFGQAMLDLLCGGQQETSVFVEWESGLAPTIWKGSICVMGDAAAATTPHMGAGLGSAIEDVMILENVLDHCDIAEHIPYAFKAYDQTRRPRGHQLIEASRGTGAIYMGAAGVRADEVRKALAPRFNFLYEWDAEAAIKETINTFRKLRQKAVVNGTG